MERVGVGALDPDFLCSNPGSRVYDLGMSASYITAHAFFPSTVKRTNNNTQPIGLL